MHDHTGTQVHTHKCTQIQTHTHIHIHTHTHTHTQTQTQTQSEAMPRTWRNILCARFFENRQVPYYFRILFCSEIALDAKVTRVARGDLALERSAAARPSICHNPMTDNTCLYEREATLADERVCEKECGCVQVHGVGGVAMVDTSEKYWRGAIFVG